tara:strand:- start:622 stop:1233 length:612 start_codon:yes stop_codon:yes gene_type:complete
MTMLLKPEIGVPLEDGITNMDLKERAEAACNTALELSEHGLNIEPTSEDEEVAAKLAVSYADDPEKTSKSVSNAKAAKITPPALVLTDTILKQFGHSVAESAVQIRHLVTNKLLIESENQDPRIRMRALELLGKISDVGLFAEKSEVTVTHQSTEDLRDKLRSKLEKIIEVEDVVDAEYTQSVELDGEVLDVDAEFGPDEYDD